MGWFAEQAGGLNRVFDNLMRALPQEGVSVQGLVAGTPEVAAQTDGRVVAFTDIAAPLPTRWRAARRAALQLMDAQPPDLIASHFTFYTAPLGRHLRDRPLVMHFHGPWAAESAMAGEGWLATQLKRRIEQRVYRSAGLFIVLSEAFRDVLHRTYGIPHERIRIVPGGADVDRFDVDETRVEARLHLGWPTDRPLIFAVRRLQRRMGIEALLAAMKRVRAQVPDVLLMIAGSGPLAPELEARIDELGLHQHVRLLGYLPEGDLPRAYRAADFSVVPTVALEGFGLITVESLAAGTPVLVTPVGGLPEVVRGLSERLVLAGSDTDALAEGLEGALSGALPLPDASACRAYAVEHFSWGTVARRVRAVYEEALR